MTRHKRAWLYNAVLILMLLSLFPRSTQAAGCTSILLPGTYSGTFSNIVEVQESTPDGTFFLDNKISYEGVLDLNISCDGKVTGTIHANEGDNSGTDYIVAKYTYASTSPGLDQEATCDLTTKWTINSGEVSTGVDGAPKFSWHLGLGMPSYTCSGDDAVKTMLSGFFDPSLTGQSTVDHAIGWQAEDYSPKLAFSKLPWTNSDGSGSGDPLGGVALAGITAKGGTATQNYFWDLDLGTPPTPAPSPTPDKKKPVISNLKSDIDIRTFLRNVGPVSANVSVDIDWGEGSPGTSTFIIADQSVTGNLSGSGASASIRVDTLPTGASTLSVTATSAEGKQSEPYTIDFDAVDVPAWAEPFKLAPQIQNGSVLYESTVSKDFPEQALEGTIDIPDAVPYLGGKWGLLHNQFHAPLSATSAGGISNATVTGSGGFVASGTEYPLTIDPNDSYTRTRMQDSGLTFDSGQAALSLPPVAYTKKVSLFSILPGASIIESIKDNPFGAFDVTALQGTIVLSLSGHARLDVDQDEVKFVGGDATTEMEVVIAAGLGSGPIGLMLVGGIDGKLVWELAPEPNVTDCSVNVAVYLMYWYPFGQPGTVPSPPSTTQILGCSNLENYSTGYASNVLASPAQQSAPVLKLGGRPDGWQPEQVVAAPVEETGAAGILSSTLVENANPIQAMPVLAAGPSGQMALSWVGEDPNKPRPQAFRTSLRLFDGHTWGAPITVSNGSNPASSPTVGWDGKGHVVVAWMQGGSDLTEDSEFNSSVLKNMDVAWAVIDPATSKVVNKGVMPGDGIADFSPQLASGTDGSVWLAWESSPASTFVGTAAAPNMLKVARWDGQNWQGAEQVTDRLVGTTRWQLAAYDASTAYLVANMRPGKITSVVAFTRTDGKWGAAQILADNINGKVSAAATYGADGKPVVAWSDQSHVSGVMGDLTAAPTTWFTGTGDLDTLLPGADGGLAAIMSGETTPGRFGTSVVRYNPSGKTWSDPTVLEDGEAPIFDMPQGVSNSSGDIVTVLAKSVPNPVKVQGADNTETTVQWVPNFASVDMVRVPGALAVAISSSTNSASGASNVPASSSLSGTTLLVLGGGAVALLLLLVLLFVVRAGSRTPALATGGGSATHEGKHSNSAATLIILLLMVVVLGLAGAYLFGVFGKQQEAVPSGPITLSPTSTAVIVPTSTPHVLPSATQMPTKVPEPSPTTEPSATSEPPTDTPEPPTPELTATPIATTVTFDKIDGCSLMSDAGAEAMLGPPDGTPGPAAEAGPVLGSCHWVTAKQPNGQVPEVSMTIYHFDGDPKEQFKTFVSRYAGEEKPVEGLGDEAVWYTSPIGGELAIRQGALIIWFLDFRYPEETIEQYAESLISNLP